MTINSFPARRAIAIVDADAVPERHDPVGCLDDVVVAQMARLTSL